MKLSEQARARELYAQGISRQVIAARLDASRSAVTKWTADMPAPEKPCPVCNERFRPKRTNQRYCSGKCSRRQDYEVWKDKNTSPPAERACEGCGQSFQPNHSGHRFCTRQCGNKIRSERHYQKRKITKESSDGSRTDQNTTDQ